jgi:heterodisulfide reductase subunit B
MKVAEKGRYLVFLGCAIPYRAAAYEISARAVLRKLGVEIVEMPQFNCCGLPIDPVDHEMMLIMASRNLSIAERNGLDILTLCPGCSGTLRKVNRTLREDGELRRKINGYLAEAGLGYQGEIKVKHLVQVLAEDLGFEEIKDAVVKPLPMLRVAEHNGCHVLRPKEFSRFDDSEDPKKLRNLIEVTGATCLDYIDETECCGAPSAGIDDKVPLQLARDKLNHIKAAGAQALITI